MSSALFFMSRAWIRSAASNICATDTLLVKTFYLKQTGYHFIPALCKSDVKTPSAAESVELAVIARDCSVAPRWPCRKPLNPKPDSDFLVVSNAPLVPQIKWHQFIWNDEISVTTSLPSISKTGCRYNALFSQMMSRLTGHSVPSQPISRPTTKQPVYRHPGPPHNRWVD